LNLGNHHELTEALIFHILLRKTVVWMVQLQPMRKNRIKESCRVVGECINAVPDAKAICACLKLY
jgi:hypothetical protein